MRARRGHRNGENRVGAELAFVRRAIQRKHCAVNRGSGRRIQSREGRGDLRLVMFSAAFLVPFPEIARLVVIAEFDGLMLAGRCAGRNGGASDRAIREINVRFDGRIAARIQNFSAHYFDDFHLRDFHCSRRFAHPRYNGRVSPALICTCLGVGGRW